jgi:hypothetical protein
MTTARLNYNGNDIDFTYGVQKYKTQAAQDMNQQRAASGAMEQININGSQEVDLTLFFDADTKAALETWWWAWARDGGEFAFALDKEKMGQWNVDYGKPYVVDQLFNNDHGEFSAVNADLVDYPLFSVLTPTASGPTLQITTLAESYSGSNAPYPRIKIKRQTGSSWDGRFYWKTAGHGFDAGYYDQVSEPAGIDDDWVVVEFNAGTPTAGSTDYLANTITGIRFDLSVDDSSEYLVQWVRIRHDASFIGTDSNYNLSVGDNCMLIGAGDNYREKIEVTGFYGTGVYTANDTIVSPSDGDILRHADFFPQLITLDKNFNPQAMGGGAFYTASFKWLEVVE